MNVDMCVGLGNRAWALPFLKIQNGTLGTPESQWYVIIICVILNALFVWTQHSKWCPADFPNKHLATNFWNEIGFMLSLIQWLNMKWWNRRVRVPVTLQVFCVIRNALRDAMQTFHLLYHHRSIVLLHADTQRLTMRITNDMNTWIVGFLNTPRDGVLA